MHHKFVHCVEKRVRRHGFRVSRVLPSFEGKTFRISVLVANVERPTFPADRLAHRDDPGDRETTGSISRKHHCLWQ